MAQEQPGVLQIDTQYAGPFELVDTLDDGRQVFESVQSSEGTAGFARLEINTVRWTMDRAGKIEGSAKFVSTETNDILHASLQGESPDPPKGQTYREAFVDVTFEGGTRAFEGATGEAKVEAKLHDDGVSGGRIRGSVLQRGAYGR